METTQAIKVTYIAPTDTQGTRIRLNDTMFKRQVTLNFDYSIGNVITQAKEWLESKGYKVYTSSSLGYNAGWILTVDYNGEFRSLKEANK